MAAWSTDSPLLTPLSSGDVFGHLGFRCPNSFSIQTVICLSLAVLDAYMVSSFQVRDVEISLISSFSISRAIAKGQGGQWSLFMGWSNFHYPLLDVALSTHVSWFQRSVGLSPVGVHSPSFSDLPPPGVIVVCYLLSERKNSRLH